MLERKPIYIRIGLPVGVVLGTMMVSMTVYNLSGHIGSESVRSMTADISAIFMFISIWLGALVADSLAFFFGAKFWERCFASLVAPFVWGAKYLFMVWGVYSLGETLYMFLCPIVIGCPAVALLCIGISEIGCRTILKLKADPAAPRIFELGNTVVLLAGAGLATLLLWDGTYFYSHNIYMPLYWMLFQ